MRKRFGLSSVPNADQGFDTYEEALKVLREQANRQIVSENFIYEVRAQIVKPAARIVTYVPRKSKHG